MDLFENYRCRHGYFHVVNNDYTHWEMYAIGGSANPTINSQGNRYLAPTNPFAKEVMLLIFFYFFFNSAQLPNVNCILLWRNHSQTNVSGKSMGEEDQNVLSASIVVSSK